MSEWIPILVIPNLLLPQPAGDGDIAVTHVGDDRVLSAVAEHPRLGSFLGRFTDAFGESVDPSVLIIRRESKEAYRDTTAIAGFRDLFAVSTIPTARAMKITHNGSVGAPVWAETFSIYPWMIDRNGDDLICQTPAMHGLHHMEKFCGQVDAQLRQCTVEPYIMDGPIFDEILLRWHRRFGGDEATWENRALFRSLNMARASMQMPGGLEFGFYDVGRLLTLWISAFEILLHPGPGGRVGEKQVLDVLDSAVWLDEMCAHRAIEIKTGKEKSLRTIASDLYHRMYNLRSDFLHGNEVSAEQLAINDVPLLLLASSLYRVALATFLDLQILQIEDHADMDAIVRNIRTLSYWQDPQHLHEEAILKAVGAEGSIR